MDMFVSSTAFAAPTAMPASPDAPAALIAAATSLLDHLALGRTVDTPTLRAAMSNAFGGSNAEGAWDWKTGYDACEAATVLFLRRFGPGMRARTDLRAALLAMLAVKRRAMGTPDRHAKRTALWRWFRLVPVANRRAPRASRSADARDAAARVGGAVCPPGQAGVVQLFRRGV